MEFLKKLGVEAFNPGACFGLDEWSETQDKGVLESYNPATGDLLWTCDGPSELTSNTMNFGRELVYASGGFPKKSLLCIRADGTGDGPVVCQ